jgi:hypothetical protein
MGASSEQLKLSCRSCGADLLVGSRDLTARCPYCDSPSVVERPATEDRPHPAFVIGFAVDRKEAELRMRRYIASKKMAPFGLKRKTVDHVSGVYLPTYLYSATAASTFSATIAEDYETVGVTSDSDGGVKVGRKRKVEYRELHGAHTTYLGNIVVTASRGVGNDEIEAIEPFELAELRRYQPAMISGWTAEEPSLSLPDSLKLARREAGLQVGRLLHRFMPGDRHSNLSHSSAFHEESVDLALVPVWVFAIRYSESKPPIRILVNGQTGVAGGATPISWAKICLIIGLVLSVAALPGILALILELLR